MTNSADPDQLASSEANWSGSTLFAKTGHVVFSKRRVNKQKQDLILGFANIYSKTSMRLHHLQLLYHGWFKLVFESLHPIAQENKYFGIF